MAARHATKADITPACRTCARCAFCRLTDQEWQDLDARAPLRPYRSGVTLFNQGDEPDRVYLLCHGRLKQWKFNDQGRRFFLRYIEAGEVLGAITLLDGRPYPTTVETGEICLIRSIPQDLFFQILERHPVIAHHLLRQVAARHYDLLEVFCQFMFGQPAVERLALLLFRLWMEKHGAGHANSPVRVDMSREEMAERIGTTPETVSRLLGELVKRGVIERGRHITIILDPDGLRSLR